jgi:hypothetical protein
MTVAHGLLFFRITIAVLFTASTVGKLSSRRDFEIALDGLKLPGSRRSRRRAATAVIAVEAVTATLVAVGGPLLVPGLVLAIVLLAAFSLVLARALRQRLEVSCNCFGPGVRMISAFDVWRNVVMMACAVGGIVLGTMDHGQPLGAGDVALLAGMSVVFVLAISNLGDVVTALRAPL